MMSLLSIEWLKVKKYITFWVLLSLFCVFLLIWNLSISGGFLTIGKGAPNIFGGTKTYDQIWSTICFYSSHFVIFISILVVILTTNEYQFKTNRQNVIDGWQRLQFYHAKWMVILVLSVGVTLFAAINGVIMGNMEHAAFSNIGLNSIKLFWLFILTVNYLGFAYTLSLLLKRSGIAIALLLLYYMIIETIIHSIFFFKYQWFVGDMFLPLQSSDELLRQPAMEQIIAMMKDKPDIPSYAYALASCGWIAFYYILGRWRMVKSDW
ncbi:MAG: hypothetical protein JST82_13555 [Bacteroidetes bacterium]|nr:hypothetical protein [Bacteroidota bacterium]